ncbi:MAG: DUF493 family protein [Salinivirgaceae bacterium]|jgi:hypothetical protein|nr:DUF493 family protein [Salinivirgaceae bacterium]
MENKHYKKLRELLNENKQWPMLYMFKFIVPNSDNKVNIVTSMMPEDGDISYKHTKNLKYISITCKVLMKSAASIIELNEKVGTIEGVISL